MSVATETRRGRFRGVLDLSGAGLATLCAVHCALTPVVLALLPILGLGVLADERVERTLVGLSAALGLASLGLGFPVHRSWRVAAILLVGLAILGLGVLAEEADGPIPGAPLMPLGGLTIAAGHLLSRRRGRAVAGCPGPSLVPLAATGPDQRPDRERIRADARS